MALVAPGEKQLRAMCVEQDRLRVFYESILGVRLEGAPRQAQSHKGPLSPMHTEKGSFTML